MNIDKDTLRALADACKDHQPLRFMRSHGALYIRNDIGIVFDVHQNRSFPDFMAQNKDYADLVLACTPATILALLAENDALRKDTERYQWLRSRDLETISHGGVFAGITPHNMVLNEETLDAARAQKVQP